MSVFFRWSVFVLLAFSVSCQSVRQSTRSADDNDVMDVTISTMRKDAIRLEGKIEAVNEPVNDRNIYSFRVAKIIKYGATFSSAEPKVGEMVLLATPKDVSYEQGQVITIDVLTPRFKTGDKPMQVDLGQP